MKKARPLVSVFVLALVLPAASAGEAHHLKGTLVPVEGSSVAGHVNLVQLPHGGTLISVVATGLQPGGTYLSLYYDNDVCEIEPYGEDDVVGTYIGNAAGVASTVAKLGDDLDEIGSVSVRNGEDFSLLACAKVHPAEAEKAVSTAPAIRIATRPGHNMRR